MTEPISSAANPLVKRVRLLADRKIRRREGAFVVEGVQPVWRAVEAGWQIEVLLVCPDLLAGSPALAMVEAQRGRGVRVVELTSELFGRISDRDGPSGLAAVVRSRPLDLTTLDLPADAVVVALHEVANPGNLGTIVRTADAAGAAAVVLIGPTADPYAPAAVKASMGSLFGIRLARVDDAAAFFAWAEAHRVQVVATSGYAEQAHWDAGYRPPVAVLLGSEGDGLPGDVLDRADLRVRIPMTGTAESLNLAVAAGVMIYELRRHALA
ncbi:MAG TPA: RNA methyltransferase [Kineosporiaceae bacterium]|nr:RNA methyltransferase [Kineosporiaceae bacterium]